MRGVSNKHCLLTFFIYFSFVSKDRSNLGSYDQCELYRTQSGHAHGQRFPLFQSSQEDVFGGDGLYLIIYEP